MKTFVLALDLAGTFVFALTGAMTAVKHRLDLFGILVLSLAAATFGGIGRDLLIGSVPPAALADWRYLAVPLLAGVTVFFSHSATARFHTPVLILDAAGLALFAISGALKALTFGLPPIAAIILGVLTGIGGGIARDILVAEVPIVLRADLYAVAALAGAAVVVIGDRLQLPSVPLAAAGGGLCFALRFMAVRHGWHLPHAWQSHHTLGARRRSEGVADGTKAERNAAGTDSGTSGPFHEP